MKNNTFYKNKALQEALQSKIMLLVIISIVCFTPVISAFSFDNTKSFNPEQKEITIKNAFGLPLIGSDLAVYKLTDNSDSCLVNCYAEGTATIYIKEILFTNIRFRDKLNRNTNINSITFYIKEKDNWVKYENQEMPIGTYEWRIEGNKKADASVDWQVEAFGIYLTDFEWWNAGYSNKKQINITGGSENLTNFPVYLEVASEANMQPDYDDLRFVNNTENQELYFEIDWQNSSGAGVWVNIPRLTNFNEPNTTIYMYYGNPSSTKVDYQDYVWGTNAVGIYHMTSNSTNNASDSSLSHNNLTLTDNIWINTTPVKGFGSQLQFPGAGASGVKATSIKSSYGISGNSNFTLITKFNYNSTGDSGFIFELGNDAGLDQAVAVQEVGGPTYRCAGFTGEGNFGTVNTKPHWLVVRYIDSGTLTCWLDGVKGLEVTPTLTLVNTTIRLGTNIGENSYADIVYDEFQLYNTSMSSSWLNRTLNLNDSSYYTFSGEIGEPLVMDTVLDFPESEISQLNRTFFGVANYTAAMGNLTNASLYIWYSNFSLTNVNITVINGTTNRTNLSISGLLPHTNYSWNYLGCAVNTTDYVCEWGVDNRTFEVLGYQEKSSIYNTTSYESLFEHFEVNITTLDGVTPTNPKFFYNGSQSTATVSAISGNDFKISAGDYVPSTSGSTIYNWTFSFDVLGVNQNITKNQTVGYIQFGLCNASLNVPYLNFTFKDETSLDYINASVVTSNFVYHLSSTTSANRTLTYSNTPTNQSYAFCAAPESYTFFVSPTFSYKNTGYPQRTYGPGELTLTNNTFNKTLYLLADADGLYVTFQVINSAEQPISGVQVNATRIVDSVSSIVGSGTTDDAGAITFWLNPDYSHTFSFFKEGYDQYTTVITPTQSSYTVNLGGSTTVFNTTDYTQGVSYNIRPSGSYLQNETDYLFTLNLSSSYWDITNFGFVLLNGSGTSLGSNSSTTNGGYISLNKTTGNNTKIVMDFFWVINSTYVNGSVEWRVYNDEAGNEFSIKHFFDDLKSYGESGIFGLTFGGFSFGILIFLFIFIFTGVMSYMYGINSPEVIVIIVFGLVSFFEIGVKLIPTLNGFPVGTVVLALLIVGLMIREAQK